VGITSSGTSRCAPSNAKESTVVVLGIILIIIGLVVASLHVLFVIGIILLLVGLVLNFLPVGGNRRRVW